MTRVLITGARGFVGRQIATALAEQGVEVHAITSTAPDPHLSTVTWHHADLHDAAATAVVVSEVAASHLVHSAWETAHGTFWHADSNYRWVGSSLELAQAFVRAGGRRLVGIGSCAEYDWRLGRCSEEATPLTPIHPYGVCKVALSRMWRAYADTHGLSFAWARLFHVYGPHESRERLVPSVTLSMLRGEEARCTSGEQVRDIMHIADAGRAVALLALSSHEGALNVGSGEAVQLKAVAHQIGHILGRNHLVRLGALPDRVDDPRTLLPDTHVLTNVLGFRPLLGNAEGLASAVAWWRSAEGESGSTNR